MKDILQECWLYIEPTVFIFKETDKYLFYDSESKKKIVFIKTNTIEKIVNSLLDLDNLYCVLLPNNILEEKDVVYLISQLRQAYMCDIIPTTKTKPVVIPPVMKCHAEKQENKGHELTPLLSEITFYVNGYCDLSCKHCSEYYRQFKSCYKNKGELSFEEIKKVIGRILPMAHKVTLNFNGGNILHYSQINKLFDFLQTIQLKSNIHINYLNLEKEISIPSFQSHIYLHLYITFPLNIELVHYIIYILKKKISNICFIFIVEKESDVENAQNLVTKFKLEQYVFMPFYNKCNKSFFENYVFIDEEDLINERPRKIDVFKRQYINLNNVGKLIISSDGHYFSNLNFPTLGNIDESIAQIINKEWSMGKAWKLTRTQQPCTDCIYQYLCPSPSNYEIVFNKNNLCKLK